MIITTSLSPANFNVLSSIVLLLLIKPLAAIIAVTLSNALIDFTLMKGSTVHIAQDWLSPFTDGFICHNPAPNESRLSRLRKPVVCLQILSILFVFSFATISELIFEKGTGSTLSSRSAFKPNATTLCHNRFPIYNNKTVATLLKRGVKFCMDEERTGNGISVRQVYDFTADKNVDDISKVQVNCSTWDLRVELCAAGKTITGARCNNDGPVHVCKKEQIGIPQNAADFLHESVFHANVIMSDEGANVGLQVVLFSNVKVQSGKCNGTKGDSVLQDPVRGVCSSGSKSNVSADKLPGGRVLQTCMWMYDGELKGTLITGVSELWDSSIGGDGRVIPLNKNTLEKTMNGVSKVRLKSRGRWTWIPDVTSKYEHVGDQFYGLSLMRDYINGQESEDVGNVDGDVAENDQLNEELWIAGIFRLKTMLAALMMGTTQKNMDDEVEVIVEWVQVATYDIYFGIPVVITTIVSIIVIVVHRILRRSAYPVNLTVSGILKLAVENKLVLRVRGGNLHMSLPSDHPGVSSSNFSSPACLDDDTV